MQCTNCHTSAPGALAGSTRLIFTSGDGEAATNEAVFANFVNTVSDGANLILDKVSNTVTHGGGQQLATDSQGYMDLEIHLATLGGDADITADLTAGWRTQMGAPTFAAGPAPTYDATGVSYMPDGLGFALIYDTDSPVNLRGATYTFKYMVDSTFKNSGSNLQPFVQEKMGFAGDFSCFISSDDLVPDTEMTKECSIPDEAVWDVSHDSGVQFLIQPVDGTPATNPVPDGTVTVTSFEVFFADP